MITTAKQFIEALEARNIPYEVTRKFVGWDYDNPKGVRLPMYSEISDLIGVPTKTDKSVYYWFEHNLVTGSIYFVSRVNRWTEKETTSRATGRKFLDRLINNKPL